MTTWSDLSMTERDMIRMIKASHSLFGSLDARASQWEVREKQGSENRHAHTPAHMQSPRDPRLEDAKRTRPADMSDRDPNPDKLVMRLLRVQV